MIHELIKPYLKPTMRLFIYQIPSLTVFYNYKNFPSQPERISLLIDSLRQIKAFLGQFLTGLPRFLL